MRRRLRGKRSGTNGTDLSSSFPRKRGSSASDSLKSLDSCFRRNDGNWSFSLKSVPFRSGTFFKDALRSTSLPDARSPLTASMLRDRCGLGGTAQIVNYHLIGTLLGLIGRHRLTRHVLDGGDESLLYHIVCSRSGADGEPAADLRPLQAGRRSAAATVLLNNLPAAFRLMFASGGYLAMHRAMPWLAPHGS
jgi:hypothetical protein